MRLLWAPTGPLFRQKLPESIHNQKTERGADRGSEQQLFPFVYFCHIIGYALHSVQKVDDNFLQYNGGYNRKQACRDSQGYRK
jgi:hypothetical protein